MVTNEFAEASAEIDEIIKYLPIEYTEKIPTKLKKFFKDVKAKEYVANINPYKKLDEQELKPKTKTLLTILYRNYWCDENKKNELDNLLNNNDKKYEELLIKKYNPDNIFMKKHSIENKENLPTEQKNESFIRRVIQFLRKVIFKK